MVDISKKYVSLVGLLQLVDRMEIFPSEGGHNGEDLPLNED